MNYWDTAARAFVRRRSYRSYLIERAIHNYKEQTVLDKFGVLVGGAFSAFTAWDEHSTRNWKYNGWSAERKLVSKTREFAFSSYVVFCVTAYLQPIADTQTWHKMRFWAAGITAVGTYFYLNELTSTKKPYKPQKQQ